MMFPDKVGDYSRKFATISTYDGGSYFSRPVGQEFDTVDEVMRKYMTSKERGLIRPKRGSVAGTTIAVPRSSAFLEGTNGVFTPTKFYPEVFQKLAPLLDRSNTPRKAAREISLERNKTNKRWLYPKITLDEFNPTASAKEIARGKLLRRITRQEDKQMKQKSRRNSG
jgi:hypothetical protein